MSDKIKLVQGDTRPTLVITVTDQNTGSAVSLEGCNVVMKFREAGTTTIKTILTGALLPGRTLEDGTIDFTPPYNLPGVGGRVAFQWSSTALDTAGEFEGEIEVTFQDAAIQTVYNLVKFKIREQF